MNSLRIWQMLSKCMASFAIPTWNEESRTNCFFPKKEIMLIFNRFSCYVRTLWFKILFLNELVKIPTVKSNSWNRKFISKSTQPIISIEPNTVKTEQNIEQKIKYVFRLKQNQIKRWTNTPAICWISNFDIIAVRSISHIWYDKFARVLS